MASSFTLVCPGYRAAERRLAFTVGSQLVAEMDDAGVAKAAIVHSSTTYGNDNSYVADSVAAQPLASRTVTT